MEWPATTNCNRTLLLACVATVCLCSPTPRKRLLRRLFVSRLEICVQKVFRCLPKTSLYFTSLAISRSTSLTKRWKEYSSLCSFRILLGGDWEQQRSQHLHFFCRCPELMHQTFDPQSRSAKLQQRVSAEEDEQQPHSIHLWAKKRCSFSNRIVFLKENLSIRNNRTCHWWQLLQTAKRAIMIDRCQGDDTFVVFQPMGIFRFRRNRAFTVFQR